MQERMRAVKELAIGLNAKHGPVTNSPNYNNSVCSAETSFTSFSALQKDSCHAQLCRSNGNIGFSAWNYIKKGAQ